MNGKGGGFDRKNDLRRGELETEADGNFLARGRGRPEGGRCSDVRETGYGGEEGVFEGRWISV